MPDRRLVSQLTGVLGRIIARVIGTGFVTFAASINQDRTKTLQNTTATLAELETAQEFTATQTFSGGAIPASQTTGETTLAAGRILSGQAPAAFLTAVGSNAVYSGTTDTNRTIFALGSASPAGAASIRAYMFGAATDGDWNALLATPANAEVGFLLHGHDGSAVTGAKGNIAIASGSLWTASNNETYVKFSATLNGSTTLVEVARIQNSALSVGNVVPTLGNGLVQLSSGTTSANGFACGTDTHWYRDSAGSWSSDSNIKVATVGKGIYVKEGTNATMGAATLVAGSVVISTNKITSTSRIFLTSQADGGTVGFIRVSARTAATSFTVTSSSVLDTSTVAWIILEPA